MKDNTIARVRAPPPRVDRILLEDMTTQSALSTFIGAFIYSPSAIVLYRVGVYAKGSSIVVMGLAVKGVVSVIVSMLRWIEHLTDLGSVDDSLHVV